METVNTIVRFFQEGGAFMYPIMLVLAIGVAIAIERYLYLTVVRGRNRKDWRVLQPIMESGDLKQAMHYSQHSKAHLSQMLSYALTHSIGGRRADDIEQMMEEGLMELIPRLEKRTPYLATFANIATLLGLLGTILGLIAAFSAVANADPAEKANLLSSSISVAMNTTAFGLIAAIPLLLIHAVIQTKTTEIIESMEMATVKFTNIIRSQQNKKATPGNAAEA